MNQFHFYSHCILIDQIFCFIYDISDCIWLKFTAFIVFLIVSISNFMLFISDFIVVLKLFNVSLKII